jgi:hypothetical protein
MNQVRDANCFHLTAYGWVTGARPPNAVETWCRWSFEEPRRRRKNVGWTSIWADTDVSRADRNALRQRFPNLMGVDGRDGDLTITMGSPI